MTAETRFTARYFDGRTARPQDVSIALTGDGIAIYLETGALLATWALDKIVLAERPRPEEPARIGLEGTTARLIVEDAAVLLRLAEIAPAAARRVRTNRRTVLKVGAWAGLAIAALAVIVLVLIPLLSDQLAARTPERVKRSIGDAALTEVVDILPRLPSESGPVKFCLNVAGIQALQDLANRLMQDVATESDIRTHLISARLVNAFALPGGIVVLTDGLLQSAESPDEIAGILAHEIGHVIHAHPTQAIFRTTAVSLLISALIGDFTGGVLIAGVAEWVLNSAYSRDAEREADQFAIDRLNAVGIDGKGLTRFFERLLEEYEQDTENPALRLISTHPPTRERMEFIRSQTRATGASMTPQAWKDLKNACQVTLN